jgi:hypothetical protein
MTSLEKILQTSPPKKGWASRAASVRAAAARVFV